MAITVEGVPSSIAFSQLAELCRTLGVEPDAVVSIHIATHAVEIEMWAENLNRSRYVAEHWPNTRVAKHLITIPVVRPGDAS